jgi:hypothetical protein
MRFLFLCLLSLTLFAADPPPAKPLPVGVDPIVKEYQDSVAKAKAAYEATCAKAQEKALVALDAKNKEIIKKGDVDGAIAVKAVIERVKGGKVRDEAEKEVGLLGEEKVDVAKLIVGKWKSADAGKVWTFSKDKTFAISNGDSGTWEGKGDIVVATCPSYGWKATITVSSNDEVIEKSREGIEWILTRVK